MNRLNAMEDALFNLAAGCRTSVQLRDMYITKCAEIASIILAIRRP